MALLTQSINQAFIRITQLVKQVQTELTGKVGNLSQLSTSEKQNLVVALNEIKTQVDAIDVQSVISDDEETERNVWSAAKVSTEITRAITNLINGADEDSDTLKELADKIVALVQADQGLLSVNAVQDLTDAQRQQARQNLGLGALAGVDTIIDDEILGVDTTWSSERINNNFIGVYDTIRELDDTVQTVANDVQHLTERLDTLDVDTLETKFDFVAQVNEAFNNTTVTGVGSGAIDSSNDSGVIGD